VIRSSPTLHRPSLTILQKDSFHANVRNGQRPLKKKPRITTKAEPPQTESPFEKHRGIGNPGIPSGRKSVNRHIRRLRNR
jgi:hypothetical protein